MTTGLNLERGKPLPTPRREDNVDTYDYFGDPIYQYSLAEGIADGFLAPYRVHRIITDYDATGWRPTKGELDRYGREIPDTESITPATSSASWPCRHAPRP